MAPSIAAMSPRATPHGTPRGASPRPSFLEPAFSLEPPKVPGDLRPAPPCQAEEDARDGPPEMPPTPMSSAPSQRPPSASGERSRAQNHGYVKLSEVEATMKLNGAFEKDNAGIQEEIAALLRMNIQLRSNICIMEDSLGRSPSDDDCARDPGEPGSDARVDGYDAHEDR